MTPPAFFLQTLMPTSLVLVISLHNTKKAKACKNKKENMVLPVCDSRLRKDINFRKEATWEQTWGLQAFQPHAHLHSTISYSHLGRVLALAKFHQEISEIHLIRKRCGPDIKHLCVSTFPRQLLRRTVTTHSLNSRGRLLYTNHKASKCYHVPKG